MSRTTSLPHDTIRLNPTREPAWMNASVTEPDWAIPATPPRGWYGDTSPMYVALFAVRSTTPMQFGPTSAIPCSRAIRATSTLHGRGGFASFDDPAAGNDHGRYAGRRRRLRHDRCPERVERHDRDVGPLGQRLQ